MIYFVSVLILTSFAQAKTLQQSLEGKWQGYCSPNATEGTSKMCSYNFSKNGEGNYQCEQYKDLRCKAKAKKNLNNPFHYSVVQEHDKTGKVSLDYDELKDVKQEKHRVYITGDVLRVQTYEVVRLPSSANQAENLEAQGVIPFFEFTRAK
jgi:hypothetical protein